MELRHLEVFLAIVDEGTLTAAGERLRLVQSGVSTTLRTLEAELGAPLFVRTARQAILTDAGQALVPEARTTLAAAAAAREAVRETRAGVARAARLGTMTIMQLINLPRLLARFQTSHPRVTVSLRAFPDGSVGLLRGAGRRRTGRGLRRPQRHAAARHRRARVGPRAVAADPAARPPAGRPAEVTLAELADERWVDSPLGFGNRAVVDQAFGRASLHRQITLETVDASAIPEFVAAGLGVALVPNFFPLDQQPPAPGPTPRRPTVVDDVPSPPPANAINAASCERSPTPSTRKP